MKYATVDPADTAIISTVDLDGRVLTDGETVRIPDFAGGERWLTITKAEPQWDLYDLTVDPTVCGGGAVSSFFYVRTNDYALIGDVKNPAARVQETATCTQRPIADVYAEQRQAVIAQDQQVRYNAVDSSLAVNWWLIATQSMRNEIGGIQGNWAQRQIDGQGFPTGPNAPWVAIFNASTLDARRYQVTSAANWNTLFLELTQHDQATGNATESSRIALDAAYADGAGDWTAVATHDPEDPTWGYPPIVELPVDSLFR